MVSKIGNQRPDLLYVISDNKIQMAINTVSGQTSARAALLIRSENLKRNIPTYTTISALEALVEGLGQWSSTVTVAALQDFYPAAGLSGQSSAD